jgi:hypothetical protein
MKYLHDAHGLATALDKHYQAADHAVVHDGLLPTPDCSGTNNYSAAASCIAQPRRLCSTAGDMKKLGIPPELDLPKLQIITRPLA